MGCIDKIVFSFKIFFNLTLRNTAVSNPRPWLANLKVKVVIVIRLLNFEYNFRIINFPFLIILHAMVAIIIIPDFFFSIFTYFIYKFTLSGQCVRKPKSFHR